MMTSSERRPAFVPETRIGFWFLGTRTWTTHVLRVALRDLDRLMPSPRPTHPVVLDAGCGQGLSFRPLIDHLAPQRLIGIDVEEKCLVHARAHAARENTPIDVRSGDIAALDLPDACVDMIFCHQTFHHLVHQEATLREFYRILKPGGMLLFAESTRAYIYSWIIRLLFRHPMEVQRSAEEYMSMLRAHGFEFGTANVSLPYLWWSRSDLGALEWFGFPMPAKREETLVNVVATKPIAARAIPTS